MPGDEQRAKMWKYMIPEISEEDSAKLAKEYSFSGGQIENIARKSTVEYVLGGEEAALPMLMKMCGEEVFSKRAGRSKVGFKN